MWKEILTIHPDNQIPNHIKCRKFLLDLHCDKHAVAALWVYAVSCEDQNPTLSEEIKKFIKTNWDVDDILYDLQEKLKSLIIAED